jgi:hypothetical protein
VQQYYHKAIKAFGFSGIIHDEASILRLKEEYARLLATEMILSGYVPRLDINTNFTIKYNENKEIFEFKITSYGTYVGKKKSQCIQGIDGTTAVPILKSKSNGSLLDQESK